MSQINNQLVGKLSMLGFALVTAFSSIAIHSAVQETSALLSVCNTFIFCLIFYGAFSIDVFKKFNQIRHHKFSLFMLNITTAFCWIFTFAALKRIPSELFLFMYLCAIPISASFLYNEKINKSCFLIIGLMLLSYTYRSEADMVGIVFSLFGGLLATVYSNYSKKLIDDFSMTEILSLRFYLTVIITLTYTLFAGEWRLLSFSQYSTFLGLSVISVILPITLYQLGLQYMNGLRAVRFLPLGPLLAYFITLAFSADVHLSFTKLCSMVIICFGMLA